MKRIIVTAAVAALLGGGAVAANAGGPGPNGHNNWGLCNAYQSGSQQGQDQKRAHGQSFLALAETAGDYNGDGQRTPDDVIAWCNDNGGATNPSGSNPAGH